MKNVAAAPIKHDADRMELLVSMTLRQALFLCQTAYSLDVVDCKRKMKAQSKPATSKRTTRVETDCIFRAARRQRCFLEETLPRPLGADYYKVKNSCNEMKCCLHAQRSTFFHRWLGWRAKALAPGKRQTLFEHAPACVFVWVRTVAVDGMIGLDALATGDIDAEVVQL
jgi:hypothetical protein